MKKIFESKIIYFLGILFFGFYLLNPTAGVFELIPDNLPYVGNLDEAAAVMFFLACWRKFRENASK